MARSKNWTFTYQLDDYSGTEDPINIFDEGTMKYLVFQVEKGTHLHVQGFVSYIKQLRFSAAKSGLNLGDSPHLESAKGTPSQNRTYCTKEETRVAGPWEYGNIKTNQGQRTDLEEVADMVKTGAALSAVAAEHPTAFIKYSRGIQALAHILNPSPPWRNVKTIVLWGPTGVGKTRAAVESGGSPYFVVMPGTWWDGYEGQDTIIFDDFYGQIRHGEMLRWLDGYAVQIPVKGGFTGAHWTTVYITSNTCPDDWYKGVPEDSKAALNRRFTEIIHMT